jgi:hypothetical protein
MLRKLEQINAGPFMRGNVLHKRVVLVSDPAAVQTLLARSGEGAVPKKAAEYVSFDLATGMHGHHRWVAWPWPREQWRAQQRRSPAPTAQRASSGPSAGCSLLASSCLLLPFPALPCSILTEQVEERWVAVRKALSPAYGTAAIRANFSYVLRTYQTMCTRIASAIERSSGGNAAGEAVMAGGKGCGSDDAAAASLTADPDADFIAVVHSPAAAADGMASGLGAQAEGSAGGLCWQQLEGCAGSSWRAVPGRRGAPRGCPHLLLPASLRCSLAWLEA